MKITCITDVIIEVPGDSLVAANLDGLNLHRALLEEQDMSGASLVGTDLRGAFMWKTNLSQAKLDQASVITTDLRLAKLLGASLRQGRAMGCQFDEADLSGADLEGVDVGQASFVKARLHGARLLCHRIELASFAGALFDNQTLWPPGFDPIAAGAVLET